MARAFTKAEIDSAFAMLVRAARAGQRCPKNKRFGVHDGDLIDQRAVSQLCRDGRILVEVYPHNFRRVTILDGEHKGIGTAAPENKDWRPYRIIGKSP